MRGAYGSLGARLIAQLGAQEPPKSANGLCLQQAITGSEPVSRSVILYTALLLTLASPIAYGSVYILYRPIRLKRARSDPLR